MNFSDIFREPDYFLLDIGQHEDLVQEITQSSSFLVIGGAGSIGKAVVRELALRNPAKLHVVDISENNLVELQWEIRSSIGYTAGEPRNLLFGLWQHRI